MRSNLHDFSLRITINFSPAPHACRWHDVDIHLHAKWLLVERVEPLYWQLTGSFRVARLISSKFNFTHSKWDRKSFLLLTSLSALLLIWICDSCQIQHTRRELHITRSRTCCKYLNRDLNKDFIVAQLRFEWQKESKTQHRLLNEQIKELKFR